MEGALLRMRPTYVLSAFTVPRAKEEIVGLSEAVIRDLLASSPEKLCPLEAPSSCQVQKREVLYEIIPT